MRTTASGILRPTFHNEKHLLHELQLEENCMKWKMIAPPVNSPCPWVPQIRYAQILQELYRVNAYEQPPLWSLKIIQTNRFLHNTYQLIHSVKWHSKNHDKLHIATLRKTNVNIVPIQYLLTKYLWFSSKIGENSATNRSISSLEFPNARVS